MTNNDTRAQGLAQFASFTGLDGIAGLTQRGRDPDTARFTLRLTDGRTIDIGNVERLFSHEHFDRTLAVTIGQITRACKRAEWHGAVGALVATATDIVETPQEGLRQDALDWLDTYARGATSGVDIEGAVAQRQPFIAQIDDIDHLHISVGHFVRWIKREQHENQIVAHELRAALDDLGFVPRKVSYTLTGRKRTRTSARYVHAPLALLEDDD